MRGSRGVRASWLARRREVEIDEEPTRLRFALETANRRLKHLVGVDALTGIANRRHFDRALRRRGICGGAARLTDRVTISGGVATIYPPATIGADELLFAADKALYRAKCPGRNRIATAEIQSEEKRLAVGG